MNTPKVDMRDLARRMNEPADRVLEFAPPSIRRPQDEVATIDQIKTFGELPTKELDEIVEAAEARIEQLKADMQVVRDMYVKQTSRIVADVKRLQKGVEFSMDAMKALRQQCEKLNTELEDPS